MWEVGKEVAVLATPPISRATLALYAGASGDHNSLHIDSEAARASGLDDVIAQGMLVMAYLGRTINMVCPPERVRRFSTRFLAMTHPGEAIVCRAVVAELGGEAGRRTARLTLTAASSDGEAKVAGEALIAIE